MNRVDEDDHVMDLDEEKEDEDIEGDADGETDKEESEEEVDEDTDEEEGGEEDERGKDEEEEEGDEENEDEAVEGEGEAEDSTILSHYDIFNITAPCHWDESVSHVKIHAHQPQASSSLNNNDEIRIAVQGELRYGFHFNTWTRYRAKALCTLPVVLPMRMV